MTIVGDPSRFAIEYGLTDNHGGEWIFGRFCYWCAGRRVGDYELGVSLRDVLFQLDQLARDRGKRSSERFSSMPPNNVFRILDGALFGASDVDNAEVAEEDQWARHNIFPPVDVFDSWKGFLVEGEQTARLIFACTPYDDVCELALQPGEVDGVLDAVRKALDEIHEDELHKRRAED